MFMGRKELQVDLDFLLLRSTQYAKVQYFGVLFSGPQHILPIMVKERKEGTRKKEKNWRREMEEGANVTRNYQSEAEPRVWPWNWAYRHSRKSDLVLRQTWGWRVETAMWLPGEVPQLEGAEAKKSGNRDIPARWSQLQNTVGLMEQKARSPRHGWRGLWRNLWGFTICEMGKCW